MAEKESSNHRCPDCDALDSVRCVEIFGPTFRLECKKCGWWLQLYINFVGGVRISTKEHPDGATYWLSE
jgi:transcription elongation factor Elf1